MIDDPRVVGRLQAGVCAPRPGRAPEEAEIVAGWGSSPEIVCVSIVCHAYNHENSIADALDGFLNQKTNFPFEIIIHDDASDDATPDVINAYKVAYPSLITPIFQHENQYALGLKPKFFTFPLVRGRYIAFCEADDYWLDSRKLQIQRDFLDANQEYAVCGHNALCVRDGKLIGREKLAPSVQRDAGQEELKRGFFIANGTSMYRANFESICEEDGFVKNGDSFMFSRLGFSGKYHYSRDLVPAVYREHSGGIWSSLDSRAQRAARLNTIYWMSQYYRRKGDSRLAQYWAGRLSVAAYEDLDDISLVALICSLLPVLKTMLSRKMPAFAKNMIKKVVLRR